MPHSGPSFHASPSSTGVSGIRKDFVLRKRGKSKQSVTIPAAQPAGSSQWMRSSLCHAAQPGKDTAATGTSAERKRPSQRCVTSREPDPEGKEEGAGMSIPRAGLLHRSHDSFPPRGSPGSLPLLPKKGPLTNAFGHSHFARKSLEKRNKTWYFVRVTLDKETRTGHQLGTTQGLLFSGHSTFRRVSSSISPEVHLLLRKILCREVIQVRTGFLLHLSFPSCAHQEDLCYRSG